MTNFIHWTPCPARLTLPTVGSVACRGNPNLKNYGDVQLTTEIDNEKYECDMCGACCRSLILEGVYDLDIRREPQLRDHAYAVSSDEDSNGWGQMHSLCKVDGACSLLGPDNECQVYPTRPFMCLYLQPGDEQCQLARDIEGLPPPEPVQPAPKSKRKKKRKRKRPLAERKA